MPNGTVVLVVEDMPLYSQRIKQHLLDSALVHEVVVVERLLGAVEAFEQVKDRLGAVLMDACMERDYPDTLELTRHIRANFDGVIVAMSRDPMYRRDQMEAGCNHEAPKHDAAMYLVKILAARNEAAA